MVGIEHIKFQYEYKSFIKYVKLLSIYLEKHAFAQDQNWNKRIINEYQIHVIMCIAY